MNSSPGADRVIVMQSKDYSCGPAALATVLSNMGIQCTEQELAEAAGTDESGTSMYGLILAARSKGLNARGVKMDVSELKRNCIAFVKFGETNHYTVIDDVNRKMVVLADPSLGKVKIKRDVFARIFTGNVILIEEARGR